MMETSRIKVELRPNEDGEIEADSHLFDKMADAGWTGEPGDGITVLTDDGREVFNPVPFQPPVGWEPQETIMQMIERRIEKWKRDQDDLVVDETLEEAGDFDIDDELPEIETMYEVLGMEDEHPALRVDPKEDTTKREPEKPPAPDDPTMQALEKGA